MSSTVLTEPIARRFTTEVLFAYGANSVDAGIVADHLVDSDVAGVRSHGLIRVPQYVDEILAGEVDPRATPAIARRNTTRVEIEGARCFGQTACIAAVRFGSSVATERGLALVTAAEHRSRWPPRSVRRRAWTKGLPEHYLLQRATLRPPRGSFQRPRKGVWGQIRSPTQSLARGPRSSVTFRPLPPEGRIRRLQYLGQSAPPDTLLDSAGRPTTDPRRPL